MGFLGFACRGFTKNKNWTEKPRGGKQVLKKKGENWEIRQAKAPLFLFFPKQNSATPFFIDHLFIPSPPPPANQTPETGTEINASPFLLRFFSRRINQLVRVQHFRQRRKYLCRLIIGTEFHPARFSLVLLHIISYGSQ